MYVCAYVCMYIHVVACVYVYVRKREEKEECGCLLDLPSIGNLRFLEEKYNTFYYYNIFIPIRKDRHFML